MRYQKDGLRRLWKGNRIFTETLPTKRISIPVRPFASKQTDQSSIEAEAGALSGVRILDLSRVLAAPFCTQILSDYGADVLKIEDPSRGDDTRYWRITGEDEAWDEDIGPMSNYFAAVNRNKRSITLNLKHARSKEIFLKLVESADVVVENLRPGALDRLGLGYDVLSKRNRRVILASTSGYGPSGPMAQRAGYDMIAGAEAGLMHITGERSRPPVRPGLGLTDMCTGLYMHGAICAALHARERTGEGQKLDGSLFETQVSLLTNVALSWLNLGVEAERWGAQHPSVVPYDAFATQDSYIVCGATNDKQFAQLVEILGQAELAQDDRFRTNPLRVKNREELYNILHGLFAENTTDQWLERFGKSSMPYAPINTIEKVFSHEQTAARDMVLKVPFTGSKSGSIKLLAPAVKFSKSSTSIRQRPPLHGEHTKEVLKEIGISDDETKVLQQEGAI